MWKEGSILIGGKGYRYWVKQFDEGSQYGIDGGRISGFIDLGDMGVGDKWRDIALCYRSLKWNAEGAYGGKVYPGIRAEMLFDALGIAPDEDKVQYYILLDELF